MGGAAVPVWSRQILNLRYGRSTRLQSDPYVWYERR